MKYIINQYDFFNKHPINQIRINEDQVNSFSLDIGSIILPNIKSVAKRLAFFEIVYINDKQLFNKFLENKIFSFEKEYDHKRIAHYCYPKKNENYHLHQNKFKMRMLLKTFGNNFRNNDLTDLQSNKLCFYKPNMMGLEAANWNKFEMLKIKKFNEFEKFFIRNKFQIIYEVEALIKKLFENHFSTEKFWKIMLYCIKEFTLIVSFLNDFIERNLILPDSDNIVVGSESRVLSKLLRYNLINKNKKIYSFEHGARSFLFKADYNSLKENKLKFTTNYYLTGKGQYNITRKYKDIHRKIILSKNIEPKIKNIISRKSNYSNNKKILYVMQSISTIYNTRSPHTHDIFYYQKLYNKIIKFYDENNYYYKIKNHPDSTINAGNSNNQTNKKIDTLFNEFDILVFDHSDSTAFCEAINTNKKIILIDVNQNIFEDEFDELIRSRCSYIEAKIELSGLIKIDENYFKECIENDMDVNNDSIHRVESFFSPK
jgi:hypothetical protein